jgi:GNAT superfamily N-acetyltransferase
MAMVTVRPATVADAPAMGRVHVRAWQAAYRGHMPDGYLDGLRVSDRAAHWEGALRREDLPGVILVAERAGEVIGFAAVGPSRDPEGAGELYAINLDPAHWGTGAGRALLEAAQAELARPGIDETVLWVLSGNARARRFYEIAGWVADGSERTSEVFGVTVHEVRYRRRSSSAESSSVTPAGTE